MIPYLLLTSSNVLAAERLLQETEGSVETAVALYFSSVRSRIVQEESASPLTQLQAILGTSVTNHQAEELLARANNSVQEAVDLYYTTGGDKSSDQSGALKDALLHICSSSYI